ncbi:hypothetical protein DDE18_19505 [Nocardioides gansuensis]|uniref:Probable membrane transporter protein n=1 Tax=Nocardioides gansuensis TaxID=2138300 RepID=A0A2T8F5P8_9ACTN|nr:hypothetical protein DDE18_19505 [Nocardioides gansuensis]
MAPPPVNQMGGGRVVIDSKGNAIESHGQLGERPLSRTPARIEAGPGVLDAPASAVTVLPWQRHSSAPGVRRGEWSAPVDGVLVALWVLILVSATMQSVSGFGYALLSAPILMAVLGGPFAISTVLITGTACDLAILAIRRQLPRPVSAEVRRLALWSVPGMAAGAVLLVQLPARWLQVLVALVVIAAVAIRVRAEPSKEAVPNTWAAGAGFASGALSTSTHWAARPRCST